MSQGDRESNFEKALSRHFRASCPDAETLAAYCESALAPQDMLTYKAHIASCSACQEVLAHVSASEKVSLQGESMGARESQFAESDATRLGVQATGAGRAKAKEWPGRVVRWRWAAPAGAIAAGLLVWVTLREMNHPAFVSQPPAPVAARTAPANPPANASEKALEKSKVQAPTTAAKLQSPPVATKSLREAPQNRKKFAGREALPEIAQQKATRDREVVNERGEQEINAAPARTALKRPNGSAVSESVTVNTPAPPAAGQQMMVAGAAAPAASPSPAPPTPQAAEDKTMATRGALVGGAVVSRNSEEQRSSNVKENALVRAADMVPWELVASPGATAVWHVGGNGSILYSADKGAHWQAQASGVTVALSAGSAPTDQICWVVGQKGTVLRTADGGAHWEKISSPISSDLGGVQAADALHAKIWDTARRQSYETSDGGATWKELRTQ